MASNSDHEMAEGVQQRQQQQQQQGLGASNELQAIVKALEALHVRLGVVEASRQGTATPSSNKQASQAPEVPVEALPARNDGARKPKAALPDPAKFSGSKSSWPAWRREILTKLKIDGEAIGERASQFAYVYARLEARLQATVGAFFDVGGRDGLHDPFQFIEYMDSFLGDPDAQARAIEKLETLRQGKNEGFSVFLPKFERLLAESGGQE